MSKSKPVPTAIIGAGRLARALLPPLHSGGETTGAAGGGYAHGRLSLLEPVEYEEGAEIPGGAETFHEIFKSDEGGWSAFAGTGYEFRISSAFAAGVSVSYNYLDIGADIYDKVRFVPVTMHLNWYF